MKAIEWGDCFSYGPKNRLELNNAVITQLIGENGSGKSSISLIIQEVLFNKNSKGVKKADIPNRNTGSGKYWINFYFDLNDEPYEIQLSRAASIKVKLYKNGEDISSHTATETFKTIEELMGMDFKVFVQLIYQSITDGLSFLTATDTIRKKFLIDLFQLEGYTKYFEIFKNLVQTSSKKISSLEGSISALEKIAAKASNIPEIMEILPEPDKPQEPEEITSLSASLLNIVATNKQISNNEQLKKLLKNTPTPDYEALKEEIQDTSFYISEQGRIKSEITHLKSFIQSLSKLKEECPTCGSPIDVSKEKALKEEAEQKLRLVEENLKSIETTIKDLSQKNLAIKEARKLRDTREDLIQRIDHSLSSEPLDAQEIQNKIKVLKEEYSKAKDLYDSIVLNNAKAIEHNKKREFQKEQLDNTLIEIEETKNALFEVEYKVSIYEILKKSLSTNGLVAYKLENLVKDIEDAANNYLLELSDGRFSLLFTISGDKLNVTIDDNGNEIEINALSSGELARVNTATLLAIRHIMSNISKTQINVLFLDEVINVLDEYGREKLIEVLLEEKNLNTFLVSHGWSHPLLAKIQVAKTDGVSYLKEI